MESAEGPMTTTITVRSHIATGNLRALWPTRLTAGNAVIVAVNASIAWVEDANSPRLCVRVILLLIQTPTATDTGLTLGMILPTAGNAATSAVSAKFANGENAKRASVRRFATEKRLILQQILPTAGNAVSPVLQA